MKKWVKVLLWISGAVTGLLLLTVALLQLPLIRNFAKNRAITYIEQKIETPVYIENIAVALPLKITLKGFYFESRQKDTLLAGEKLAVDISLIKLFGGMVEINSVELKGIVAGISRNKDSVFNFDYIVKAFAPKQPDRKPGKPMRFSVRNIDFDNISVKFNDAILRNEITVNLFHFDIRFRSFSLEELDFDIPQIGLDGLMLRVGQDYEPPGASISADKANAGFQKPAIKLKLGRIALTNMDIGYDNAGTKLTAGLTIRTLLLKCDEIDFTTRMVNLDNFKIDNSKGSLLLGKHDTNVVEYTRDTAAAQSYSWNVKVKKVKAVEIAFQFDDENYPAVKNGMDYRHLDIHGFNLGAETVYYNIDTISGNISSCSVNEKCGLNVQSLKTSFFYGNKGASWLKNLYLKTPQTLIADEISIAYASVESIGTNPGRLGLDASIINSRIAISDILLFVPDLKTYYPFKNNRGGVILINSRINGKVSDIHFPVFEIGGIGTTSLSASGRITGMPDMKNTRFDVTIDSLCSTAQDVEGFVPSGTIPATISLPAQFALRGTFNGEINNFIADFSLTCSYGNAEVKALFDSRSEKGGKYNAAVELAAFDLGKLIRNNSLGKITLHAKVNGAGMHPKTAQTHLQATLVSADFNTYRYRNLNLKAGIKNGLFTVEAGMNDQNLDFDLAAQGGFNEQYPSVKLHLDVHHADLEQLKLHTGPLQFSGRVDADIPTADPDYLNGKVGLHHVRFLSGKEPILLDSITLIAETTSQKQSIRLKSQFLKAEVRGKYKLSQLPAAIQNSVAVYFDINPAAEKLQTAPQQLTLNITFFNDPVLIKLVPELTALEPVTIKGRYTSATNTIVLTGTIPRVVYGANTIWGGAVKIDTKKNALVYDITIDAIQSDLYKLTFARLSGNLKNKALTFNLQMKDNKKKEQYAITGTAKALDGNTEIRLNPDGLKLNYESWVIGRDNLVRFGKSGIYADNFELSNAGNAIKIQSQSEKPDGALAVTFMNFKIETILNMVKKDALLMRGQLNGNVVVRNLATRPVFTSDIVIKDFSFRAGPVGDISVKINNETADRFAAYIAVSGNENSVTLDGFYKTGDGTFNMNLAVQRCAVKSIQSFTFGNLSKGRGHLAGTFIITGTAERPKVVGELRFNDVSVTIKRFNSYFKATNEKITFTGEGISFDNFTVSDKKNNKLSVNGTLRTQDYRAFRFDLAVDAGNFRVLNSEEKDNDLYYGDLFLDARLVINGLPDSLAVKGRVKIRKDTKLTVVLPQADPSIVDREGIVEFVDDKNNPLQKADIRPNVMDNTGLKGMDVSVDIEIDRQAELSLVIDKGNGDYLTLKGDAKLSGAIDLSGKTTLVGKYEFTEGAYEMSFNLIKRKFDIQKGSSLIWDGEPTSAVVNITAIYTTDAAPIDLFEEQLGDVSPAIRNTYKQKIPFQTLLMMNGELLKPEITFDIVLPDGNYAVSSDIISASQTKLEQIRRDPGELNKQVFALLILNRFIGQNPLASESGITGAETLTRQSVSKILSQQLNNLAGYLIKGVEIEFDLESTEDYSSGQMENRTDLDVGFSKKLFKDRLKVSVGSSFGLEGKPQQNQQSNIIAGDLSADYQLSRDGRYLLRVYRKNEYQVALQGQIIETGVAFIITLDYNRFRELFHRTRDEKI